ncbi:MAG: GGDEF domain-containing protein, partial [Lachnospiraceae bacterium]|nr:GGDEF domain-containing protein [Lachnospiraceae bacterium]
MNPEKEWNRARFVVVERDNDGTLLSVLFMVETIDEEKKARDRLLYLSETDSMTGINNRGSGENKVRKLLLDGDGGMFMLLDVDKFKSINDTYGHAAGDKVLISIAECMRRAFRNNDVMMRLGGDEFAAFAPMVYTREGG